MEITSRYGSVFPIPMPNTKPVVRDSQGFAESILFNIRHNQNAIKVADRSAETVGRWDGRDGRDGREGLVGISNTRMSS